MRNTEGKKGIALVVTMGFLAMLTILAVGFAISMRTESMATASFTDMSRTQILLDVAVMRAIDGIEQAMSSGETFPTFLVTSSVPDLVTQSVQLYDMDDTPVILTNLEFKGDSVDLFTGDARDHVPGFMHTSIDQYMSFARNRPLWWKLAMPYLKKEYDDFGQSTNAYPDVKKDWGEIAYMIVNVSGMLDANFNYGAQPVRDGLSPEQIQLGEAFGPSVVQAVSNALVIYKHFEDYAEFEHGTPSSVSDRPFFIYSYSPQNLYWARGQWNAKINPNSGDPVAIKQGFIDCGFTAAEADQLYASLIDYRDPDEVPNDLASCGMERVPMINEVVLESRITRAVDAFNNNETWTHDCSVTVELWNPFTNDIATYALSTAPNFGFRIAVPPKPIFDPLRIGLNPTNSGPTPDSVTGNLYTPGGIGFHTVQYTYPQKTVTFSPILPPPSSGPDQQRISVVMQVKDLVFSNGTEAVDQVMWATDEISMVGNLTKPNSTVNLRNGASVRDPRMNFDDTFWGTAPPTLNAVNNLVPANREPIELEWFIRNGDLENAAELGFLSYGQPMETVALYNGAWSGGNGTLHPVLDVFAVPGAPDRGQINVNTLYTNVLAVSLVGMTTNLPSGGVSDSPINWNWAENWAKELMQMPQMITNMGVSVIGADVGSGVAIKDLAGLTVREREAIVGNVHRLFNPRQQLFLIIAAARSLSESKQPLAEERAVALVWRDPCYDFSNPSPLAKKPTIVYKKRLQDWD